MKKGRSQVFFSTNSFCFFIDVTKAVKIVVNNRIDGDIHIIKISQPMELAFGSKKIKGTPKFLKSDVGPKRMGIIL
jgi:hypothetical protein